MEESVHIDNILQDFQKLTHSPENFLDCDNLFCENIKYKLKNSYDTLKTEKILSPSALPELLIKNFDTEQIWQQIELQNENVLNKSLKVISKFVVHKNKLIFENLVTETQIDVALTEKDEILGTGTVKGDDEITQNEEENRKSGIGSSHESEDSDDEMNIQNKDNLEEYSSNEDSNNEDSNNENTKNSDSDVEQEKVYEPKNFKKSKVDDEFFKLDEMEKFLVAEEKKSSLTEKNKVSVSESDSEAENSIDLFETASDDEEELKVKTAKFKDFFRANDTKEPKRNKFLQDISDEEDENIRSTFEARQERLNKKIQEIEENAIGEKPWILKGEITADKRPQNSLLEEILDFDLTSRPVPVITEKTTLQLEDIIRQRIKDKYFDSVERKEKPVETPLEYKKKLVLDQEKSKHSLAQIYEKEYLEQQASLDPDNVNKEEEEPELHKEIRTITRDLFNKLDALSNFHFTPKPSIPELRIITNIPAVTIEEVAPVTTSDAALLAPEEIKNKSKGDIIGKSERSKTDKNRERRKKKQKQRNHLKQIVNKSHEGKKSKLTGDKNIEKMNESAKVLKSSKAFFSELEDQAKKHVKSKKIQKTGKSPHKLVAKKIKI